MYPNATAGRSSFWIYDTNGMGVLWIMSMGLWSSWDNTSKCLSNYIFKQEKVFWDNPWNHRRLSNSNMFMELFMKQETGRQETGYQKTIIIYLSAGFTGGSYSTTGVIWVWKLWFRNFLRLEQTPMHFVVLWRYS